MAERRARGRRAEAAGGAAAASARPGGPDPDRGLPRFVEVAFNLPVKREFTYRVPDGMEPAVGCRVSAPFGSRKLTGVVVGAADRAPEGVAGIREIARVVDKRPLATGRTLELARWMARMYLCSLGEALATVLPGGRREGETDELPLTRMPATTPWPSSSSPPCTPSPPLRRDPSTSSA